MQLGIAGNISLGLLVMLLLLKPLVTAGVHRLGLAGRPVHADVRGRCAAGGGRRRALGAHLARRRCRSAYALIGGGAFLAAAMQGPLAGTVLVLELTGHFDSLMVPTLRGRGRGDGAVAQARRRLDLLRAAGAAGAVLPTSPPAPTRPRSPTLYALDEDAAGATSRSRRP